MSFTPGPATPENQRQLERQRDGLEARKQALGSQFYGYGDGKDGSTKGFDFHAMTSHKRAWNNPVLYHSLNAAGLVGGSWGLYFFFRHPVHNKLFHVTEMLRRTLVGSLCALPFTFALASYARSYSLEQSRSDLHKRGDNWRRDYLADGGKLMEAPPNPMYRGPQGMAGDEKKE
ncbi:hypothetical protein DIPPA_24336 [Diplonema papillatum]|nr:hypothetical protein DIPPA_24336 [Diplonema papillatum]